MTIRTTFAAALAALAATAAAIALALLLSAPASAGHLACHAEVFNPSYSNGIVTAHGEIQCSRVMDGLYVRIQLTKDGTVVASNENSCSNQSRCHVHADAVNSSGDQRWCSVVVAGRWSLNGDANNLHDVPKTNCEDEGF
ncbi:MAG TPA: hypothetical protein VGW75_03070 [Solirubrobacteraceae bacterium]|jgi:hypothetical protein|nr:hypothetical protein [Solirubrobacteraceae bacterium]